MKASSCCMRSRALQRMPSSARISAWLSVLPVRSMAESSALVAR